MVDRPWNTRSRQGQLSTTEVIARIRQAREAGIEIETEDSELEEARPHNDVLTEMSNFLADEDIHRKLHFEDRLRAITDYVATLREEDELDRDLLNEVKDKSKIHWDWVRKETEEKPVSFNFPAAAPESLRLLPLEIPMRRAVSKPRPKERPFGDEHPPFTTKRMDDHSGFVQALQADADMDTTDPDYNERTNLAAIEERAYRGTVANSDNLRRHDDEEDMSFPARAAKRGIRRAAIEKGLQILASNDEQEYEERGRWDKLTLPHDLRPIMPEEVPFADAAFDGDGIDIVDPFAYTKIVRAYREQLEAEARQRRNEEIHSHHGDSFYFAAPPNFNGPYLPVHPNVIRRCIRRRQNRLFEVVRMLRETEQRASRQLIREALTKITQGLTGNGGLPAEFEPISDVQVDQLLVLTQPSSRANREPPQARDYVLTAVEQQQADRLDLLASYIRPMLTTASFPRQTSRMTLQVLLDSVNANISSVNTPPFAEAEIQILLPILEQRGLIS